MTKIKYHYNPRSLKYEQVEYSLLQISLKVLGFLSAAIVFAALIIIVAYSYFDSPKEKLLIREINELRLQYEFLDKQVGQLGVVVNELEDRDDNIYRVIFEAEPIPSTIRQAGSGGTDKYEAFGSFENGEMMKKLTAKADQLIRRINIQSKSYDELYHLAVNKEKMFASIPAIQPLSEKDLVRLASGYGYRIDPIYKTVKLHEGIDFTAPRGTPIYATGDGKVSTARFNKGGYGNSIIIDHGYGYKTQYAHLQRFAVFMGQTVTRGQVIGYVGSTGKSTAPHCHYEVIKNGVKVDPINFFYNDLNPEQYLKLVELASANNQSFD
ncbi:MAG: M23 family metallopeptidase [Bacteroidetes bacterium]|nr:M23 family metallopeptidase [Bacteroidota bacterium]